MTGLKTYRDVKIWIDAMSPIELDMTATVALIHTEEVIGIVRFVNTPNSKVEFLNDILDDNHPVMLVEF